jgi:hypothetical protein
LTLQVLSAEVASYLGLELGKIKIKRFADGEIYVQVQVRAGRTPWAVAGMRLSVQQRDSCCVLLLAELAPQCGAEALLPGRQLHASCESIILLVVALQLAPCC